jgi:hypothetical protein
MRSGETASGRADFDHGLTMVTELEHATVSYDRVWVQYFRATAMVQEGRYDQALDLAQPHLEDALARGDHTVSAPLAAIVGAGLLAADQPESAAGVCERATAHLRVDEVTAQDFMVAMFPPMVDLYRGRARAAWFGNVKSLERIFASPQSRFVMRGTLEGNLCGVAAAAANQATDVTERRSLKREAERLAKRARSTNLTLMPAVPSAVLACLRRDRVAAISALRQYLQTERVASNQKLACRRLGELLQDDEGAALIAEADAFLRAGGVVDPARFTAAMLPGIEIP